jgi:hypothetical protein
MIGVAYDVPDGGIDYTNGFGSRDEAIEFAKYRSIKSGLLATVIETAKDDQETVKVVWRTWFDDGVEVNLSGERVG